MKTKANPYSLADINSMLDLYLKDFDNLARFNALCGAVMHVKEDVLLPELDKFRCCRVSLVFQNEKLLIDIRRIFSTIKMTDAILDSDIKLLKDWSHKYCSYDRHHARCLYSYYNNEYGGEA